MSKISELSLATELSGSETLAIVQDGNTVKTTAQDIANLVEVKPSLKWRTSGNIVKWTTGIETTNSGTLLTTTTGVVDANYIGAWTVAENATRFRVAFPNHGGSFTLKASVEVPNKQGATPSRFIIPLTFDGGNPDKKINPFTGVVWSDWIPRPVSIGDIIGVKVFLTNMGSDIFHTRCGQIGYNSGANMSSARINTGIDSTNVLSGTGVWTNPSYRGESYLPAAIHTDCKNTEVGIPSVDVYGTSMATGHATTSWYNQILSARGGPYANFAVGGSSQLTIPNRAPVRILVASGDIVICEHGRNSDSTSGIYELWKYLRGLGYRKIIQINATNATNAGNTAVTSNISGYRAYLSTMVGKPDGFDVLWDLFGEVQDPATGLWRDSSYTQDGVHLSAAGETYMVSRAKALGWLNDLI